MADQYCLLVDCPLPSSFFQVPLLAYSVEKLDFC